jgi:hypothetical protein
MGKISEPIHEKREKREKKTIQDKKTERGLAP